MSGGRATLVAVFPPQRFGKKRAQSVPTAIAAAPDGSLYVGELGGEGTPKGKARVWRIEPGKKPAVFATGFSNVTGVAVDANGNVYVGELVKDFAKAEKGDLTGSVYKVASDGTRSELAKGKLKAVGGVAVGPDGAIYVSVMSVLPHGGQIVRVAA